MIPQRYVKFLSKRTIVSIIGIDYSILKEAGEENIHKFYLAGLLVVTILLLSFFSVFYAFELMFHMWYAEIFLAMFFALMFFTIYVLLIQTFSKEVLSNSRLQPFFTLSNIGRMAFVLMIGFIISQPIKIFFLQDGLDTGLSRYKNELVIKFSKDLNSLYKEDILYLQGQKDRQIQIFGNRHPSIAAIDEKLLAIESKMQREESAVKTKISGSDFFVRRILLCNSYVSGWLISIAVVAVFAIPVFLIYSISSNSRYYRIKKTKEVALVNSHYQNFKRKYTEIFIKQFGIPGLSFYEKYQDAPFNTIEKHAPPMLTHDDFKTKFIG